MSRAVICFTRVPVPGRTKTRLLPVLSGAQCAALHTAFLQDLSEVFGQVDADLFIAHTPEDGWQMLQEIFPRAKGFFPQRGAGLGDRMADAMEWVLAMGYGRCLLVGADLPLLTAAHLESAFAALEGADVVLGPNPDGGYYLAGLKAPCPPLFSGKRYGNGTVYEEAVAAVCRGGYTFAPAMPCGDVDDPEDLKALRAALEGADSHTARSLRRFVSKEEGV